MKIYFKEKKGKIRNIYIFGFKIFSYTKNFIEPTYDDENAILRTTFLNKKNEILVNMAKHKDYNTLITSLFEESLNFKQADNYMGGAFIMMNTLNIELVCK